MPAQKPLPPFCGSLKLVNCTPHRPTRKEAKLMVLTLLNTGQFFLCDGKEAAKLKNNKLPGAVAMKYCMPHNKSNPFNLDIDQTCRLF
jgi:hypothetical protein